MRLLQIFARLTVFLASTSLLNAQNFSIPATVAHSGGTYSIYRSASDSTITINNSRKLVIWVEGFEIVKPTTINDNYKIINAGSLASNIHAAGYDIAILNFNNASDQIQRNARVLKDFIITINSNRTTNDQLVIMGYSMGGLVARYSLVEMENQNIDHKTRLYISYDAPHNGAHVPASVQSLALTFNSQTWRSLFPELATLLDRFNSPAAQQMLKYRVTSPTVSQTLTVSPSHTSFFNELNTLNTNGGFPRNCQSVALSLGNWSGTPQRANFDSDGDGRNDFQYSGFPAVYINFPQGSYSGPQSIWNLNLCQAVGAFSFQSFLSTASAVSYPYYASRPNYLSLGNFDYVTYWYRNSTGTALLPAGAWSTINNYDNNAEAIDFAPGSLSDTYNQVVSTLNSQINCSFAYYSNSTFVPTVSALAFNTTDLFYKIGEDVNRLSKTPFSDIFATCGENSSHSSQGSIATNQNVVQWVMSKINGQVTQPCFCSSSASISGVSSPVCATGTFTLQNLFAGTPVTWFSSNPSGFSINSLTGSATRLNNFNGQVTVTAAIGGSCGIVTVSTPVIVGSQAPSSISIDASTCPEYYFDASFVPGGTSYFWQWNKDPSGPISTKTTPTTSSGRITFGSSGNYRIGVKANNACGASGFTVKTFTVSCAGSPKRLAVSASPNPATSILIVQRTSEVSLLTEKTTSKMIDGVVLKDEHGRIHAQSSDKSEIIEISVSSVPAGIYYLFAQVDGKTEVQRIVITK